MKKYLIDLIENKAFGSLEQKEKSFVLKQMTEEEYTMQHELIQQSRKYFSMEAEHLKAAEKIRATVLSHLRNRKSKSKAKLVSPVFGYKVPAWAAVAAVLLVSFTALSYQYFSSVSIPQSELLFSHNDTVYVERIITDTVKIFTSPDTVYMERDIFEKSSMADSLPYAEKDKSEIQDGITMSRFSITDIEMVRDIVVDLELGQKPSGTSLKEDSIAQMLLGMGMM